MTIDIFRQLCESIRNGKVKEAVSLTKSAIKEGVPPEDILEEGLMPGIKAAGVLFSKGDFYLPELMVCGKSMKAAVAQIEPYLTADGKKVHVGKYLIATVKGDIHDIGKNIVIMMLKGNGWKVTDLGVDVAPKTICEAIKGGDHDIFGMSTLLTVTMPEAIETIQSIEEAGLRDRIKIMIGGAPVTQKFADKVGADAYGKDAFEAVTKALNLLGRS